LRKNQIGHRIKRRREKTTFLQLIFSNLHHQSKKVTPMTSRIYKLFQFAAISTLAIAPLTLNLSPLRAQSINEIGGDLAKLTTTITHNSRQRTPIAETTDGNFYTKALALRQQSMAYVASGYEAEQAEDAELALTHYYLAMKVDTSNGWAFLMTGRLLGGNTEIGDKCLRIALQLFEAEGDTQGYAIAEELLES
jgi:hypothetical protein